MAVKATLKRAITLPLLVFYGAGTILGAGIYALIGKIAALSGQYAPFSFLLSALIAAFVAFTYAELSGRYPKSAGEAVYVHHAFQARWLTALVGWGIVLTGIVSAAVMARGAYGYLNELIVVSEGIAISLFVLLISLIAIVGISLSVNVAALVTLIEISGILLVLFVSREQLWSIPANWHALLPPFSWPVWQNIILGAFLAFYAFIGFEDMVNVAEEVIEPEKNLPSGIILALLIATVFYVLVALAAVLTLPIPVLADHKAPFALIFQSNSDIPAEIISLISLIAIMNGALVQIVMASRVLYGLAEKGAAPACFAFIHDKTRTPVIATLFFAAILLTMALWLPIAELAKITSFIILTIFALISLSLCIIKIRDKQHPFHYFKVPLIVPAISFLLCLSFIVLQFQ
ncbi:amino acid permease [Methylomarinum sp. Ch1-1]|uniref:Amino acid permease n=1 Tax=Methylomarinum roseum TaxID=3067653 RepID=A0AAU7P046_9GAMM|nr:amino acid permease [Methylomarinum sp. Ch1-1]MDP4521684.1 amino acid permease [Methylomarinum sp. Ch1-1]